MEAFINVYPPGKIEGVPKIKKVYAGFDYSILEDEEGKLWAFGENRDGQLGIGNTFSTGIPTEVLNLKSPLSISLGSYHTLALKRVEKANLK